MDLNVVRTFAVRNRAHLVAIVGLLIVQACVGSIVALYYKMIERPELLRRGAVSCDTYKPTVPTEVPAACDLVRIERSSSEVRETFYVRQGVSEKVVVSSKGIWRTSASTYHASEAALILPGVAIILYGIAIGYRLLRARWQALNVRKKPLDRVEELLLLYSLPVLCMALAVFVLGL